MKNYIGFFIGLFYYHIIQESCDIAKMTV